MLAVRTEDGDGEEPDAYLPPQEGGGAAAAVPAARGGKGAEWIPVGDGPPPPPPPGPPPPGPAPPPGPPPAASPSPGNAASAAQAGDGDGAGAKRPQGLIPEAGQVFPSNKARKKAQWSIIKVRRATLSNAMEPMMHIFAAKARDMNYATARAAQYLQWLELPADKRDETSLE